MTREEIKIEFDYLKAKYENETEYNAQKNLTNLYALCRACMDAGAHESGLEVADYLLPILTRLIEDATGLTMREVNDYILAHPEYSDWRYKLYWNVVLEETYDRFEPFMFYMERKRPFAKKFYEPRQYTKQGKPALKKVAEELENLEHRKYKFLGVSQPARTGKSTICIFFLCWKALRRPNSHSAMVGHSGILVKGFYKEVLNFMSSEEYVFPSVYERWHAGHTMIRDKSAEDFTITLDMPDRFATVTCRGIDATLTGAVDVSSDGILYVDDLVRDREHSLSPTRMENTFQEYLNKCVDRKQDRAQELMVGTLWNVLDPLERLSKMYANNPDYKFLRLPALDENDESNFDYVINGFSTEYYKEMRERLDNAEWQAKYQQKPYVREGLVFPPEELKYFDGIIYDKEIKRVFSVVDVAVGGGDNLSMPICFELESGRRLIPRWIYDKRSVKYTVPRIVDAVISEQISELRIEKNGAGFLLSDNIKDELKRRNVNFCKVIPVSAPTRMSKEDKINGYSDYIKNNFEFLQYKCEMPKDLDSISFYERDGDYNRAMDDLHIYTSEGKNVTDDSADSMAQLSIACEKRKNGQIEVLHIDGGIF